MDGHTREIHLSRLPAHARTLFGLELTAEQQRAFRIMAGELVAWNERVNLTAITEPEAIEIRHFLDSLSVLRAVKLRPGCRVIDVGTGAGFPGLPLRIVQPQIALTLVEATGKKIEYLQHVLERLAIRDVSLVYGRAEEIGQQPEHREQYDVALARAVARLPVLVEYLLPLLRIGGRMVALKGESAAQEASAAQAALRLLGGELQRLIPVELPEVAETHYLVVIDKVAASPAKYPRRPGVPARKPL
ncbi:MAG: 16S rRNA (guanine(527)-N(7))-methyltransferase RsmG [Anaerolineae bacterium]|nr:16S rRNA (guanine(527)-N(7))-methyltransferase RsmG [Anaerolineae bacterium]